MAYPQVFSYIDHRAFLRDWFTARKAADPAYSYAVFAQEAGCSKAALPNAIGTSRRPRASTLDAFATAMALSPPERNYLGLLVELDSAKSAPERVAVMQRIVETPQHGRLRDADAEPGEAIDRYLEHWWIPAIREMASHPAFQPDPAWVAARLYPPITVQQAGDALDTLVELDFLRLEEEGPARVPDLRFGSATTTQRGAIGRFHRDQVSEMLCNLDANDHPIQQLSTATLTLDAESFRTLQLQLHAVVSKAAHLADAREPDASSRVYQLAVQLLPISEQLGEH